MLEPDLGQRRGNCNATVRKHFHYNCVHQTLWEHVKEEPHLVISRCPKTFWLYILCIIAKLFYHHLFTSGVCVCTLLISCNTATCAGGLLWLSMTNHYCRWASNCKWLFEQSWTVSPNSVLHFSCSSQQIWHKVYFSKEGSALYMIRLISTGKCICVKCLNYHR